MDGSLDQLMRLLSNRGLEWLRQRIMALPDPFPVDHPDLDALALVGQVAPVLSGLRGRISPLEVIVLRRLTPALVRQGAHLVLAGRRDVALVDLMLAGGLVAQTDPVWQLACEDLAEDGTLPLPARLALSDDPTLLTRAEAMLTTPPHGITPDHVATVAQLLTQLYHHGARRPRLSHARAFTQIFDHLRLLAEWAQAAGCTTSVARIAFCLRLLDADHPLADLVSDLIQVQRPDGSFPRRLGFGTADQTMAEGLQPTLNAAMALHMAAWKRWRGPAPVWLQPHPLQVAARQLAARIATLPIPEDQALHAATSLTRVTGENWFPRLSPPRQADASSLTHLARICFRDPVAAHHLRGWLDLPHAEPPQSGTAGVEAAWLTGRPVTITDTAPSALTALWERAARKGDESMFLDCARLALHHAEGPSSPAIRTMTRQMAAAALTLDAPLPQVLDALDRLTLLAQLFEPEQRTTAAA